MKETKVICPKCGTEMEISEREHATVGVVIGKDSGLGTVVLKAAESKEEPLSKAQKRVAALKAVGVDTSKLFAMQTGEIARVKDGVMSVVPEDDPIFQAILESDTIPDRRLFRRWVMAQMFHMLISPNGFTESLRAKGINYQWKVIRDELKIQIKLFRDDKENFIERNRWFNKATVLRMVRIYIKSLEKYVDKLPERKCKGVPYKAFPHRKLVFTSDIPTKIFEPLRKAEAQIAIAITPDRLYKAYLKFQKAYVDIQSTMDTAFIDCYKGVGAYYTMKNMILFHNCAFKGMSQKESMEYLQAKTQEYGCTSCYEGWKLFGVMKQLISESKINIKKKMMEWRKK